MTHTSASTFIVWSVLSTALGAFLLGHLWRFDRFKCLKWSNTPYSGAFKRIMTYTYLITIPLIMIYSFGFAYIKYKEGFIDIGGGIFPKPYTYWNPQYRRAIFPLMMIFSFSWSFEMVTHLEELCFWFFLITAGPAQPDWFRSPYFRLWVVGSVGAVIYLPVVTIVYRGEPLSCEARMFTAGSIGDLVLTLAFIPILWRFPGFIRKVKAEGVDSSIIIRLRKFYELNVIRIIFRFLMQLPLLVLGADGLRPHTHINESAFWTDLLSTVAALGCAFSSVCTLLIFFPRSYEAEYQAKEASYQRSMHTLSSRQTHEPHHAYSLHDSGEGVEPSFGKSATSQTQDSDADYDDNMKYERAERRKGIVKERWGSKMREKERRLAKGTKRMGTELHEALSRRLMRLPLPRRRHTDPEGSIALSFSVPSLSHSLRDQSREAGRETTRRTARTARTAHKRSESTAEGASLTRKSTYLLTNSPVLRARRMAEEPSTSVETLEGAYGSASVEMAETGYGHGHGLGAGARERYGLAKDGRKVEEEDADVDTFALNAPAPAPLPASVPVAAFPHVSPTSAPIHIHGPRPVKKSSSLCTMGHRALPAPPTDPLGAAPPYYPPEGVDVGQGREANTWMGSRHAWGLSEVHVGSAYANTGASPSASPLLTTQATTSRPMYVREPSDMPVVSIAPGFDSAGGGMARIGEKTRGGRPLVSRATNGRSAEAGIGTGTRTGATGLTVANVSRHNTRASQVNPLVHSFTSPIDFLDRAPGRQGGNGSRAQIGWAV